MSRRKALAVAQEAGVCAFDRAMLPAIGTPPALARLAGAAVGFIGSFQVCDLLFVTLSLPAPHAHGFAKGLAALGVCYCWGCKPLFL